MKNPYIIPSLIIAAAILGGFWMLKEPVKPPDISIIEAAEMNNITAIKRHIAAGTDVDVKASHHGWSALHRAVFYGHMEIAKLLILNSADVDERDGSGETPLHKAARQGYEEFVTLLVGKGASVNIKDVKSETPLDEANSGNKPEIADLLRKHGGKTGEELDSDI